MKKLDIESTLIKKGYQRFSPSPFDGECVMKCYQTAVRNNNGDRQYFITWKKWDFSQYKNGNHSELEKPRYEAYTQLTTKDGNVIDITFLNGWEPEKAEEFMEKLFNTGWFRDYDRRDGE